MQASQICSTLLCSMPGRGLHHLCWRSPSAPGSVTFWHDCFPWPSRQLCCIPVLKHIAAINSKSLPLSLASQGKLGHGHTWMPLSHLRECQHQQESRACPPEV